MAGLSAYAKSVSLGIIEPQPALVRVCGQQLGEGEQLYVGFLGCPVPVEQTPDDMRAISKGKPGNLAQVAKYLASKFGPDLEAASRAMEELAASSEPVELQRRFRLYERFRPDVPAGKNRTPAAPRSALCHGNLEVIVILAHLIEPDDNNFLA